MRDELRTRTEHRGSPRREPRTSGQARRRRIRPFHAIVLLATLASCSTSQRTATPRGFVQLGMAALERGDAPAAERSFQEVIRTGSDTEDAAFARDSLREIRGARLFPDTLTGCSAESLEALDSAEEEFARGRFDASLPDYRRAVEGCPQSATMRVAFADAFYSRGDFRQAREEFRAAIERDPWNRAAWRYLSDTEQKLANSYAAWEAAMFAVLSDPLYEMGWVTLGHNIAGGPAALGRVRIDKPYVNIEKGSPVIHMVIVEPRTNGTDVDGPLWSGYATMAALVFPDTPGKSHLEIERARVNGVLETYGRSVPDPATSRRGFWDLMADAEAAGFLDEAIYVHLMDNSMATEYAAFRTAHRERLVEFMKRMVAPPPLPREAAPAGART